VALPRWSSLLQAGDLALERDAVNGLITGATLDRLSDSRVYNSFVTSNGSGSEGFVFLLVNAGTVLIGRPAIGLNRDMHPEPRGRRIGRSRWNRGNQ
jgi:hypothetical protein